MIELMESLTPVCHFFLTEPPPVKRFQRPASRKIAAHSSTLKLGTHWVQSTLTSKARKKIVSVNFRPPPSSKRPPPTWPPDLSYPHPPVDVTLKYYKLHHKYKCLWQCDILAKNEIGTFCIVTLLLSWTDLSQVASGKNLLRWKTEVGRNYNWLQISCCLSTLVNSRLFVTQITVFKLAHLVSNWLLCSHVKKTTMELWGASFLLGDDILERVSDRISLK